MQERGPENSKRAVRSEAARLIAQVVGRNADGTIDVRIAEDGALLAPDVKVILITPCIFH